MRLRIAVLALFLAIAAVGHVYWWYSPRERVALPDADTAPGRLLDSPELPVAVWIPYPHQNFGVLQKAFEETATQSGGSAEETLAAMTRLAGLPSPKIPGFGPLPLPPAHEMTLASNDTGERFVLAARIYPGLALFAKLAGWSANNPWLGGGILSWEGNRVEVRWEGNVWWVGSPAVPKITQPAAAPPPTKQPAPAHLVLQLRQATDPLPSGRYYVRTEQDALVLSSQDAAGPQSWNVERFDELGLFLLATGGGQALIDRPPQAMAIFQQEGSELPRAAILARPTASGRAKSDWSLPGESLLKLTGRDPRRADAAGWQVKSLERIGLERAVLLAPELGVLTDPQIGLVLGLWLDLDGGLAEVERIAGILAEVPIVPRRRRQRWSDAALVLRPLAHRYDHLALSIREHPRGVVLRLETTKPLSPAP